MIQNIPPQQCMSFLWDESLQRLTLVSGVLGVRCRSPAARLALLTILCFLWFCIFRFFQLFWCCVNILFAGQSYQSKKMLQQDQPEGCREQVRRKIRCWTWLCLFVCKPYIPTTLFWQKAPNLKLAKRAHGDSANSLVNWKNAKEMLCTWHVGWEQLLHGWQDVQASRLPRWLYFTSLRT